MKTKAELRQAHGTPVQFRRAVNKAIAQGTVGITEGQAAVLKYNREYAAAPDERGLIFAGESVNGIMAGTKTMTRRILKVQPPSSEYQITTLADTSAREDRKHIGAHRWAVVKDLNITHEDGGYFRCPYGVVGDRLWVREAWRTEERASDMVDGILFPDGTFQPIENSAAAAELWVVAHANGKYGEDWRSPMFMPRWASRLTLEITGIRVERLQDIKARDAVAEGIELKRWKLPENEWPLIDLGAEHDEMVLLEKFQDAWDGINGKRASWKENPWVWVISFKLIDQ